MANKVGRIFFTSDTHFFHDNILKYEDRPFATINVMNTELVHRWNGVVGKKDDVYILGDFSMGTEEKTLKIIDKLNGNIHFIYGNHDYDIKKSKMLQSKFCWCKDYYLLKTVNPLTGEKLKVVLMHYPLSTWDCKNYGSLDLYGHIHSNNEGHHPITHFEENSYNVGVDVNNFTPISLEEILIKINYNKEAN